MRIKVQLLLLASLSGSALGQEQVPSIVESSGGSSFAMKVAFGSGGDLVATLDQNGLVRIFDVKGGRLARTIDTAAVGMAVYPSAPAIAVLTRGGQLIRYDALSGNAVWSMSAANCSALQLAADGSRLLGGCAARTVGQTMVSGFIKTWDAESGRELASLSPPKGIVSVGGFSADGRWAAGMFLPGVGTQLLRSLAKRTSSGGLEWLVFEVETGKEIVTLPGGMLYGLLPAAHRALLVGGPGLVVFDTNTGKPIQTHPAQSLGIAMNADNSKAVSAGIDQIKVIDVNTGLAQVIPAAGLPATYGIALAQDNDQLAVAQSGAVMLLRLSRPGERRLIGNQAAQMISSKSMEALMPSQPSYMNLPRKEQKRIAEEYMKKMMKAKGAERQRLADEYSRILNGDQEAKRLAEKRVEAEYVAAATKFGGIVAIQPAATFLASGRLLALRSADGWWDVWDVSTGNRLPFRKPAGDLTKYRDAEALLDQRELSELEADFTGKRRDSEVSKGPSLIENACRSEDGRHRIEVQWDGEVLRSAKLISSTLGRTAELLDLGIDLSAWKPARRTVAGLTRTHLCSLSGDGARIIVEGLKPGMENNRGKLSKTFRPKPEDYLGKLTSDSLVVYDTGAGKKVCELENATGKPSFEVLADELKFSADGKLIVSGNPSQEMPMVTAGRESRVWDGATCKQRAVLDGMARLLGFTPDGRQLLGGTEANLTAMESYGVKVWDAESMKLLFEIPDALASPKLLITTPKGNVLLGPDRDHALGVWDRRTGRRLGSVRPLQEGEWLATTPGGLFDGSPRAWNTIAWRDSAADIRTRSSEIFFNEFYRPGLVAELIAGRVPGAPRTIAQVDRRQPKVTLTTGATPTSDRAVKVKIRVEEATAGARDLRLFRNGSLVKAWRGDLKGTDFETDVALRSGENRLTAYAFNRDNVKSVDAEVSVQGNFPQRKGTAYVLAIGVNRYANPEFNLNFAVPDATRMAEKLATTQQELGAYANVVAVPLLNENATRANILLALGRLGSKEGGLPPGAPTELSLLHRLEPEDTVLVYFAGHGLASGDRFYLIPHDLGYSGPRAKLRDSLQAVLENSISDQDLELAFEPVDGANLMLIIDACNSGKVLESDEERRGPLNSKGLAQLAYEKGMFVLTAAQSYQAALESSRLGHGYLTYALAEEGLSSQEADFKPADGQITVVEWFEYATRRVPQLQLAAMSELRDRQLVFDVVTDPAEFGNLQTPRLYYRRDDSNPAPVVSKRPAR